MTPQTAAPAAVPIVITVTEAGSGNRRIRACTDVHTRIVKRGHGIEDALLCQVFMLLESDLRLATCALRHVGRSLGATRGSSASALPLPAMIDQLSVRQGVTNV